MRAPEQQPEAEMIASVRCRLYRLLANGFAYPDRALFALAKSGGYRAQIEELLELLPYEISGGSNGLAATGGYVDFQAHYIRLFDVGMGMPPCPLYSGIYRGGRKAVMEELTRFYNFFGLSIERGAGELPDHITTELEFVHFLAFSELTALQHGRDASSCQRAQADFLERQLVSWLPALELRLAPLEPLPFYLSLVRLANAVTRHDLQMLASASERVPVAVGGE